MGIKRILIEEFEKELGELGRLEVGTDKYKNTVDGVTKMADRIIEIEKNEQELSNREIARDDENEFKAAQIADEKRDRLIKNVLTGLNVIGGFGLAAWAFVASMNFEKEGTLTTEGGRSALRQLLRFK